MDDEESRQLRGQPPASDRLQCNPLLKARTFAFTTYTCTSTFFVRWGGGGGGEGLAAHSGYKSPCMHGLLKKKRLSASWRDITINDENMYFPCPL